jgi:hypothetical protein
MTRLPIELLRAMTSRRMPLWMSTFSRRERRREALVLGRRLGVEGVLGADGGGEPLSLYRIGAEMDRWRRSASWLGR